MKNVINTTHGRSNLALVHEAMGDNEAAAGLFLRALALQERALGADHPQVADSLHNLATVRFATGDLDEATRLHFLRDDNARFNFSLTLHLHPDHGMILLAYDFELRLVGIDALSFVRFDLNPPANRRPDKMRCHLHLNQNDDGLSVPAPLLHPVELLGLFIDDLRQGKVRHH